MLDAVGRVAFGGVRLLRLADVDMGLGRVRLVGKGGRERSPRWTLRFSASVPPMCDRSGHAGANPRMLRGAAWLDLRAAFERGAAQGVRRGRDLHSPRGRPRADPALHGSCGAVLATRSTPAGTSRTDLLAPL